MKRKFHMKVETGHKRFEDAKSKGIREYSLIIRDRLLTRNECPFQVCGHESKASFAG